jgi:hypothetical protein
MGLMVPGEHTGELRPPDHMALKSLEAIRRRRCFARTIGWGQARVDDHQYLAAREKKIKRRGFEAGAGLEMGGC